MDDVIQTKRCSKCGRILPLCEFAKNKTRKDGLANWCKQCNKAYKATYRQANKDKISEYYQANKDKIAEYRQANKDAIRKQQAEYYDPQTHPLNWGKQMVKNYRHMDRERGFDQNQTISAEWFLENIAYRPCVHCGKQGIGLVGVNRLKNTEGHIPSNCEPCCFKCNARENMRDQLARGVHVSCKHKKQSFSSFVEEHKAKRKNLT